MVTDRDETFSDYNISVDISGAKEQRTICPECEHTHKVRGQKDLSVSIVTETWYCHRCGFKGKLKKANYKQYKSNYNRTYTQYQEKKENAVEVPKNEIKQVSNEEYEAINLAYSKMGNLTENALKYLNDRKISEDTAVLAGLKSNIVYSHKIGEKCDAIAFPVFRNSFCVNIHCRTIKSKDFIQAKGGNQTCCFNQDSLIDADVIFITEGQMDSLSLMECGYQAVISCPNGAPPVGAKQLENKLSWIEENRQHFEHADKIILCMDKDEPGIAFEKIVAEKIDISKCYTMDYPEDCKDANDVLVKYGKEKLIYCVEKAKAFPISGIVEFRDFQEDIVNYYLTQGKENLFTTGLSDLDQKFGLLPSTLNILTGVPSHGKSEFMDQIIVNTIKLHNWKWAIYTPENFPLKLYFQKLSEKWIGKPLFKIMGEEYTIPRMSQQELVTAIKELSKNIKILTAGNEAGDDLDGILRRVELTIRRDNVKSFIIDPWNEVEHLRPKGLSETEYISQSLTKLRNFARRFDVLCWIIAHPAKLLKDKTGNYPVPTPWDISGSAHWRNKADCCFCIWRDVDSKEEYKRNVVELHVQKVRNKIQGRANYIVPFEWHRATGILTAPHRYDHRDL